MSEEFLPVLVAEDEVSDAIILRLAFQRADVPHPLVIVGDGQEAVDYLAGNGHYPDRAIHPLPALILLDLKMPRMNGLDVLAWLAARPDFKSSPTVVLSSSAAESDMQKARQLGARDYLIKPHGLTDLVKIVKQLYTRWLTPA
jgi:CheY-like chemotaxis protein